MTFLFFVFIFISMKQVTEYKDYRLFIQEYYEERKQKSAFTWRDFAAQAGFSSPVYLKDVSTGKKNLSNAAAERVASATGLTEHDAAYFCALVAFANAKTDDDKKKAFDNMQNIANALKVKILGADEFAYFDSWKNPVLREVAPAMPGAKPLEIAHACKPKITAAEVTETLQFLTKAGLLQKDENGNYRQTDKILSSGKGEMVPLAIRNMHRQMGTFALESLENDPINERKFTGLTLGVSESAYGEILEELDQCRKRIAAIASRPQEVEKVFRVNMQVFALTKNLNERGSNR